jgi:hypothetical protein
MYTKNTQEKQPLYWSRKFKTSTRLEEDKFFLIGRLEEDKLGTKVTVQSKRALKKDDFS